MEIKAELLRPTSEGHIETTPGPRMPGEFRFNDMDYRPSLPPEPGKEGRLEFACPRGNGRCGAIRIGNGFKPEGDKTWQWNGNAECPTLTPSINCLAHDPNDPSKKYAGCGWHAYLTNGVFA